MRQFLRMSLLVMACMSGLALRAQDTVVTGKVTTAEDGVGMPGVSISVKGTTRGANTDAEGNYRVSVPNNATLVFSFVGFTSIEEKVGARSVINVQLSVDTKTLSEIVVTGYGSQIKRDLTGNIAQVKSKDIENMPTPSVDAALQGKAAGVFVNSGSGKLGQGITVRVRGNSSISASSQPLYVVDGIPVTSGDQSNYGGETNPLADINPNDIESIEILKDASAAAIYGARAANGVVLISTKRGKAGKTNISFNYQAGVAQATRRLPFLNTEQYEKFYRQAAGYVDELDGLSPEDPSSNTQYLFGPDGFLEYYSYGTYGTPKQTDNNWQEKAFQKGPMQQIDLQLSGGNEKTKFFMSGQYLSQTGTIIGNKLERISGRLNVDHQATNWLNVGLMMSLARTDNWRLPDDNAFSNPLQMAALTPFTPFIDPNTNLPAGAPPGDVNIPLYYNPILSIDYADFVQTSYRNLTNTYAQVNLLPGLKFRSEWGLDLLNMNEEAYFQSQTVRNQSRASNGIGANYGTFVTNYNANNFFNYLKDFGRHSIDATLGMSYQQSQTKRNYVEGTQFPSDSYRKIASAAVKSDGTSTETNYRFLSYFTRVNYRFNDRYLLGASARVEGSSRFGKNSRYGFFPSVSAGWVISEENFLKNNNLISFLKLRASYGLTGNAEIGDFPQLGLFQGDAGYVGAPGQRPSQIANPDLKWESSRQVDIGIDFGILNNRINGEIDYYVKKTTDLLLEVNVPGTTGFARQFKNVGALENKGLEFVLNTQNTVGKFKWNTSFNIATNANKVTDVQGQIIEGGVRNMNRVMEGQPIGVFFTREYAGVDPNNGDALFYKNTKNPDGSIDRSTVTNSGYNSTERVVVGNPNPKFIGGITNTLSYGGIDFSIFFNGVAGNDVNFYGVGQYSSANGIYEDNQTTDQLNAWTPENRNTDVPQARYLITNGSQPSSRYIFDGSYLRLRTLSLGYTIPKNLTQRLKIDRVRVYFSAMNLATFTKYKGWDPEVNSDTFTSNFAQGNDFYTPPQPRTILFGVNIGF
ncbi:SusC/RagA family TonB-linked outer membrane protein [Runella zeae]|uniref:SusC/RagA family TonB-linked outer membrane protein n=1 Tax=Runella zeae TaxID=94255 RepID=UPI0004912E8F|nr:TonB-dependent receptor [Runella zeae]